MNPITAYQLTSMMEGVVQRGTARGINLPVPMAGKTGTTNDAKDVWFIGYSSNIVAGCYIGYDQPRSLGGASGGGLCGPVFQSFMEEAIKKYGGTEFAVPPGGYFMQDRPLHRRAAARRRHRRQRRGRILPRGRGPRLRPWRVVDGGFAMGANLPLFAYGETRRRRRGGVTVTTSTGETKVIPKKADFGTRQLGRALLTRQGARPCPAAARPAITRR